MKKLYSMLGFIHFVITCNLIFEGVKQKDSLIIITGLVLLALNITMLVLRDKIFKERKSEDGKNE